MKYMLIVLCIVLMATFSYAYDSDASYKDVIIWFNDFKSVDSFLKNAGSDFEVKYRYNNAPGIAGRIFDETALKDYDVRIYDDEEMHLFLNQSRITVGANIAESYNINGNNLSACILDTGIDLGHAAFNGAYVGGYNAIANNSYPMDDHGHGTHVAGIVVSRDSFYKGMSSGGKVAAVKVCSNSGGCPTSATIAGIDWCITNKERLKIEVISMSYGGGSYTDSTCPNLLDPIINPANSRGISVVAASGNYGFTNGIAFPACARNVISVGATYNKNVGSNYRWPLPSGYCVDNVTGVGVFACFTNRASNLDLVAPGAFVTSAALGGGFFENSGTSMAAPHVAAAVLLLKQAYPYLTPSSIETILSSSGTPVRDPTTGLVFKEINLANALRQVSNSYIHNNYRSPVYLPP